MFVSKRNWVGIAALFAVAHTLSAGSVARAQESPAKFLSLRTIEDIKAILDQEKPDPKVAARLRAEADAQPKSGASSREMTKFYYLRCNARSLLGELRDAQADCERAVRLGKKSMEPLEFGRILQGLGVQYTHLGEPKKALEIYHQLARETNVPDAKGWVFQANINIVESYIALGDLDQAAAYVRESNELIRQADEWMQNRFHRISWESDVEKGKARLYAARGQYREAESAFQKAEALRRETIRLMHMAAGLPPSRDLFEQNADSLLADQGQMKARQGRMAEGEADVRRALLSRLKATGKHNISTAKYIGLLANLLIEQGRFSEAEQLTYAQIEIQRSLGVAKDSANVANTLSQLASIKSLAGQWREAAQVYAELDEATKDWALARKEAINLDANLIATLYNTNNVAAGMAAAERLLALQKARFGEEHQETALARGMLAMGLTLAMRDAEAAPEFKRAVAVLFALSRETDTDDAIKTAAREQRIAMVVETYIVLLARTGNADAASESFRLVDGIRGRSVHNALAASGARAAARNPELAKQARTVQDLDKQIAARLGVLNNALSLPPSDRDDAALKTLRLQIDKLRATRDAAKRDLGVRFRDYANLMDPQAPSGEDIRRVLRPEEVFLSFYFGRDASFVWAMPKEGPIDFKPLALTADAIEGRIKGLRKAFEPGDSYPYDVVAAYDLYRELLQPVEAIWREAKTLVVATNGALGLLPLSALPTKPASLSHDPNALEDAAYRNVAWLLRTHAVAMVPSAASLRTLRQLPPGSPNREVFIGFGDPYFNKKQADAAGVTAAISAENGITTGPQVLASRRRATARVSEKLFTDELQRLPETAEELKAVAAALGADERRVLYLGRNASLKNVRALDLTKYRFIEFATHGLLPSKEYGLLQPALALAGPEVTGIEGDGLLTTDEVLALKLDADWVILSACNSGAGAADGAEAVSGLGRAFFYAGSRALLVTNWSVDSPSARDLVTGIFRRLAADPKLTRAAALRNAMIGLMDGPGYVNAEGKSKYTYAHPYFWAPYSLIGDGGATVQ